MRYRTQNALLLELEQSINVVSLFRSCSSYITRKCKLRVRFLATTYVSLSVRCVGTLIKAASGRQQKLSRYCCM